MIKDYALSVLFTNRCRLCQDVCDIRKELCDKCEENLPVISGEVCFSCGREKELCKCRSEARYYSSVYSPFYYAGGPQRAVLILKRSKNEAVVSYLAENMAKTVKARYKNYDFDCITFVPDYPEDRKKKGFNHSELLASELGKELSLPVFPLLNKTFKTKPQHQLSETERSGNLLGVFDMNKECGKDITDTRILLCDDIKTTGSTLDECAKTLLINGCAEVRCITACVTKK